MENARVLDERLRRIIREVSARTGGEIKLQLVEEFTRSVDRISVQNSHRQAISLMSMLKRSLDGLE
ncbi:MAG: hypothetical protein ACOY4I_17530 [Bacillota bacterium]